MATDRPSRRSTAKGSAESLERIYVLHVELQEIQPPIWRTVAVPALTTLAQLHRILQLAMGWTNSHMHQFVVGEEQFGRPDPDRMRDVKDERKVRLAEVLRAAGDTLVYENDFGDGWRHDGSMEKVMRPDGRIYPAVLDGARACPPEDIGGFFGYEEFLEAIRDVKRERHEELLEWIGGAFDPEAFKLDAVNRRLQRGKGRGASG
jgi:hypothetical protein